MSYMANTSPGEYKMHKQYVFTDYRGFLEF